MNAIKMNEILFQIEDVPEGGYIARVLGESIFTEADDLESFHRQVRDAVNCHFDEGKLPKITVLAWRAHRQGSNTGKPEGSYGLACSH